MDQPGPGQPNPDGIDTRIDTRIDTPIDPSIDPHDQRLALIELQGPDGHLQPSFSVRRWPLTLGRAIDNDIVLDDPHVAAYHARIGPGADGRLVLTALPSLNGVGLAGLAVAGTATLPPQGAALTLGRSRLRLRLPAEPLAPELPLPGGSVATPAADSADTRAARAGVGAGAGLSGQGAVGSANSAIGHALGHAPGSARPASAPADRRRARPLLYVVALSALLLGSHWISLDPGADFSAWLPLLLALPLALAGWCALWALLSKLFQHRFDFAGHLHIALPWLLAIFAIDLLWPTATAAVAAPRLWLLAQPLQMGLGALLLRAHLAHVLPQHGRAVTGAVLAMVLAGTALSVVRTWRSHDSLSTEPYMSTLPLPALRLSGSVPTATLVQDMAGLTAPLAQRVKKAREEDDEGADSAPDAE